MRKREKAMDTIDTVEIKSKIDMRDLAGRFIELSHWSRDIELAGPCPKCGGTDRFHVHREGWWKCYQCHPSPADAIEFVQFAGLATDFRGACDYLATWSGSIPTSTPMGIVGIGKVQPERKAGSTSWKSDAWQDISRRLVAAAALRLEDPRGEPGCTYLAGRGIEPEAWRAWSLGLSSAWHPKREEHRPAISLPWQANGKIKAVQYRFIDADLAKAERFSQRSGGERTLFGLDLLAGRRALILVEGELNAVSIWQAARDLVDVVSFGAQDSAVGKAFPYIERLARRYERVIVWTDDAARSQAAHQALAGKALALRSPQGLDANDLLQRGELRPFVAEALGLFVDARFDDGAAERCFQRLRSAGAHEMLLEVDSFLALETRCGDLHGQLLDSPRDEQLLGLYDGFAAAWELCRGL